MGANPTKKAEKAAAAPKAIKERGAGHMGTREDMLIKVTEEEINLYQVSFDSAISPGNDESRIVRLIDYITLCAFAESAAEITTYFDDFGSVRAALRPAKEGILPTVVKARDEKGYYWTLGALVKRTGADFGALDHYRMYTRYPAPDEADVDAGLALLRAYEEKAKELAETAAQNAEPATEVNDEADVRDSLAAVAAGEPTMERALLQGFKLAPRHGAAGVVTEVWDDTCDLSQQRRMVPYGHAPSCGSPDCPPGTKHTSDINK